MAVTPYAKQKRAKTTSKNSKVPAVTSVNSQVITSLQRREMQDELKWMVEHGKSYRWIARYTIGQSRFGWLQRVATGKRDVKPRRADLLAVRRLYDQLQDSADLDGKRLELVLELMEICGQFQEKFTQYVRLERG